MNDLLKEIGLIGIVPVIALDDAKDAKPLGEALRKGGLNCAEVTFRTAAAEESIKIMSQEFPDMLVGAGTVLTTDQVDRAVNAGAKFIVSPGLNPVVVKYCVDKNIPILPGCANPSDIEQALMFGLDVVKFFPAEAAGGLAMIKAMSAPYGNIKFMPTGGINANNLNDYLGFGKILACGGSWMVKKDMISAGKFDEITRLTKEAVDLMLGFELKHIGINMEKEDDARTLAGDFSDIFSFPVNEIPISFFVGRGIEVMKSNARGTLGHMAIATNNIERAVYHLTKRGYEFDEASATYGDDGKLKLIYLTKEMGGFGVHLARK